MQLRRARVPCPRGLRWLLFLGLGLGGLLPGLTEAPSPAGTPPERSRPYAVLRGQNLGCFPGPGFRCHLNWMTLGRRTEGAALGVTKTRGRALVLCRPQFPHLASEDMAGAPAVQGCCGARLRALLMGSIFSILLVTMILMAICVYKPLRRR
ncbi:uncharacterized protein C12orf76 homolog [Petaurus breviceps papuanus]|uniref:uncharacterized protein C12orf76 homolog n=1 Tax=Petaurus breviceps papuanus TaxID=3040969 RepID=UPI0036D9125D